MKKSKRKQARQEKMAAARAKSLNSGVESTGYRRPKGGVKRADVTDSRFTGAGRWGGNKQGGRSKGSGV